MTPNFFDYFPVAPRDRAWGLYATSFGRVRVLPGASYPSRSGHPAGHQFDWSKGRVLQEYQLLYIHAGKGVFESGLTKSKRLARGTAFLLFPGVWHRYRPESSTGWMESWIELNGAYMDRLRTARIIDPHKPVYQVQTVAEVEDRLESAYHLVRAKPPGFPVHLGLLAVQILTLLHSGANKRTTAPRRIDHIISESQTLLARGVEEGATAEKMARQLGIGYSYFRREFKKQTGFSPRQYQIEVRLRRAKELLRNTDLTVKEISERLGYHSPYHLSLDFSKRNGIAPSKWRSAGPGDFASSSSATKKSR
jgi:AraC-like DNA-binding protein